MRARFWRNPTVGSKKAPFKFIIGYCILLIALYCIVVFVGHVWRQRGHSSLYCIVLHCIALHCIALHCIALHCIALHCIALHCIALYCRTCLESVL